jgi:hypothetical protein
MPFKIHREFIGLCENTGKQAQIRVLREGQPHRKAGLQNRQTSIEVAGWLNSRAMERKTCVDNKRGKGSNPSNPKQGA